MNLMKLLRQPALTTLFLTTLCAALLLVDPVLAQSDEPAKAGGPEAETEGPRRADVEAWLGAYKTGLQTMAFRWEDDGLIAEIGPFSVPVDGAWHVSEKPFRVEHKAAWVAERGMIAFEEKHGDRAHWRYELELEVPTEEGDEVEEIHKVTTTRLLQFEHPGSGGERVMVRAFARQ